MGTSLKQGLQLRWATVAAMAIATIIALLLLVPVEVRAEVTLCNLGSAAGECDRPAGVSADQVTGRAYVADGWNNRIDVFDSTGSFLFAFGWGVDDGAAVLQKCITASGCQKGIAGSGPGQFDGPASIAVDHAAERVYVTDEGSYRVQEFNP